VLVEVLGSEVKKVLNSETDCPVFPAGDWEKYFGPRLWVF